MTPLAALVAAALVAGARPAPITRGGAQDAARRELSKAIYHADDPPWPVRLFRAVLHWLGSLLDTAARHSPGGVLGVVVLACAVVALGALLRWRLGPLRRAAATPAALAADPARTAADYRAEAAAHAAAGRHRDAVVAGLRAVVRALEEHGLLDARAGRTADELAAEVAVVWPEVAATVRRSVEVFDAVVYGRSPAGADDVRAVTAAADAVAGGRHRAGART